jgi:hypothetical protein
MMQSRLARHLKDSILLARRVFPDNPGWTDEARIAAAYIIAGDDEGYFEWINQQMLGGEHDVQS